MKYLPHRSANHRPGAVEPAPARLTASRAAPLPCTGEKWSLRLRGALPEGPVSDGASVVDVQFSCGSMMRARRVEHHGSLVWKETRRQGRVNVTRNVPHISGTVRCKVNCI
jgi:hypothetical protein